ncbi:MAG: hypothetical protein QW580_07155 [Nitrososphaerota archaeon]
MPEQEGRRIPSDYLDKVLPSLEELFGVEQPAAAGVGARRPEGQRRRKVHFYMDREDYELLEGLVARLAEMQGPIGDSKGLYSKVLRMSVKIGIRELVARVGRGAQG